MIALAWLGTLRSHAHDQGRHVPARLLLLVAVFVVWLALSIVWAEQPSIAFTALQPWVACALMFMVLMTLDFTPTQIRTIAFAFIIGVTFSVTIGLIGGIRPPTDTSALVDDGRLRGGLDDPNYLAAGIVPSLAMAVGLAVGVRSALARIALAGMGVILVLGLGATESRGGLIAAIVATAAAVVVAKRGRILVIAFVAIMVGVVAVWFAATPEAYKRVTQTADSGNGRSSLWVVGGRIFKDHPIVGVGLENYRVYAPRYVSGPGQLTFVNFIAERPHVVHNVYLQTMVEVGLVGLGLFLAIILSSLAAAHARRAEVREQGGHGLGGVLQGCVRGAAGRAHRLVLHLQRQRVPDLGAAGVRADALSAGSARGGPRGSADAVGGARAPRAAAGQPSPGAGAAGLKRARTLRQRASTSLGRGMRSPTPAPSVRPKITAAASPPSV